MAHATAFGLKRWVYEFPVVLFKALSTCLFELVPALELSRLRHNASLQKTSDTMQREGMNRAYFAISSPLPLSPRSCRASCSRQPPFPPAVIGLSLSSTRT